MEPELTVEQQRALDIATERLPRSVHPADGSIVVLLKSTDFDWIRGLLGDEPDAPLAIDPRTGEKYALVPENRYARFQSFFEDDPMTPAERAALLRAAGVRAGWDDPAFDKYDSVQEAS